MGLAGVITWLFGVIDPVTKSPLTLQVNPCGLGRRKVGIQSSTLPLPKANGSPRSPVLKGGPPLYRAEEVSSWPRLESRGQDPRCALALPGPGN